MGVRRHIAALLFCLLFGGCSATSELPDPLVAGWAGKPVCELLHDNPEVRALRCSFAPGVGHERHFHAAHFGYAISGGRARITDERGVREVSFATGSQSWSDGVAWHEIVNIGETTIVYLIIEPKR